MAHLYRLGAASRWLLSLIVCATAFLASAPDLRAQQVDPVKGIAQHVTILDYQTNRILYCDDCTTAVPPASMGKLMTILIVAEKLKAGAIKMDTMLPVSENAWRHGAQSSGSHMFLPIHSQASVRDLLHGVSIVSANDACIVLAEGISGSEEAFVTLMNQRAQALGFKSARFRNSTGLDDPEQVISSADLARLARYIIKNYPDIYAYDRVLSYTFNGKTQQNRNPLLPGERAYGGAFAFNGADGVKTGHTDDSGYGLIGSAVVKGQRRIIVFNGTKSLKERASEANRLMRTAFYDFDAKRLYEKNAKIGEAKVWMGGKKKVDLLTTAPVEIGFRRAGAASIKTEIVYDGPIPAPIKKGDVVATLKISGPGVEPQSIPLAAAKNVGRANIFSRAIYGAQTMLSGDK
jgi:D-alanyl-D-alanine carboxypeptidase (penicillin-binding protein 5/6)